MIEAKPSGTDEERKKYHRDYYHKIVKPKVLAKRKKKKTAENKAFQESIVYEDYLEYRDFYTMANRRFKNLFPVKRRRRNLNYLPQPPIELKKNEKGQVLVEFD